MSEEELYRSKIAESAGEIKSIDRLRKLYTVAITLLEVEKEARAEHDGTDYYIVTYRNVELSGLKVRVRGQAAGGAIQSCCFPFFALSADWRNVYVR